MMVIDDMFNVIKIYNIDKFHNPVLSLYHILQTTLCINTR